jgi:hypothetical protein
VGANHTNQREWLRRRDRQIVETDFESNSRDSRAKKSVSIDVNFRFRPLKKNFKKIKKKLASP